MPRAASVLSSLGLHFGCGIAIFAIALAGSFAAREGGGVAAVWLSNAAAIAILLRSARATWPWLFVIVALALFAGAFAGGAGLPRSALGAAANLVEITVVTHLFARSFGPHDALRELAQLARLTLFGLAGALASTLTFAAGLPLLGQAVDLAQVSQGFLASWLGMLVLTPLLLIFSGPRSDEGTPNRIEFALLLLTAAAAATFAFSQDTSAIFLMTPVLVLAALRLPLGAAAIVTCLACAIAIAMTLDGSGPFNSATIDPVVRTFLLQGFMATCVMLTLPVAALSRARLRTAKALAEREAQYRLLADNGSDLVLRLTPQGSTSFVSSAANRLLACDPAELEGAGLLTRIHPEDLGRFQKAMDRVVRTGAAVTCLRLRHADGSFRWLEAHCRLAGAACSKKSLDSCAARCEGGCDGSGGACAQSGALQIAPEASYADIIASLRDIHQRREAELLAAENANRLRETNRLLLMAEELASLGHGIYHAATGEITLSVEAATLLGLSGVALPPREALAQVRRQDRKALLRTLARVRRRDEPVECILGFTREEEERTLHLRLRQTGSPDGARSIFGIVSDITDKLRTERQLVTALEEARSAANFRSQFLATMSHEIRTPMTGVLGMIDLLGDETCDPAERKLYRQTLRQSADHLMAVLNDILDYSKVDAGSLTIDDAPFDLGQLLRGTLHLFEQAAEARHLHLRCHAPELDREWLRGDVVRLRQVLSNLLSNAIKFSEGGEVTVSAQVRRMSGRRRRLVLTVEDQGPGMSAAEQTLLFEPFVQGAASVGRGGTGLGLAICRRLVGAMGGTIAIRSVPGRGSVFTVELVLAAAEPGGMTTTRIASTGRSLDLLLAEDNPVNQLLLKAMLKRLNHRVTCVGDGDAASRVAGERRFDVILLDMHMPRCDGLTAAAAIRATPGPNRHTPIAALTADASAERRSLYGKPLIDALLTKPVDSDALAGTLSALTEAAGLAALPTSDRGGTASASACKDMLSSTPFDHAILAEIAGALGRERLDSLLDLLGAELVERPRVIREALATSDLAHAAAEAHSLKGASANLGAVAVAAAAHALEDAIAAAGSSDHNALAPALRGLSLAVEDTQHALALLPREAVTSVAVGA